MTAQIELYGANTGNSLRAAIALSEVQIPYTVRKLDLSAAEHHDPTYLSLNPAGKVPTLVDLSATPKVVINQSNAIIQYADAQVPNHLAPQQSGPDRYLVYDRYFYFVTDVIANSHAAFFLRRNGLHEAAVKMEERAIENMIRGESFLTNGYMAGASFSMADIAAFTWAVSVQKQLPWGELPQMKRWYEMIASRPGIQKGMASFQE
jgi:GST-like protein